MKLNSFAKFSLLSISILLMSHLAISPVIPNLYKFYHESNPNIGLTSVESLATIPAMMITIFVLLSNGVIKFIGKKKYRSSWTITNFYLWYCTCLHY